MALKVYSDEYKAEGLWPFSIRAAVLLLTPPMVELGLLSSLLTLLIHTELDVSTVTNMFRVTVTQKRL